MGAPFQIGSSIPVLRMTDESAVKAFYVDYLAFEIEWEHRFHDTPESPLYLQLRLGEAIVHLNGHATVDDPPSEVRIPVKVIEAFCEHLRPRAEATGQPTPVVVDPRGAGRNTDMNLKDPDGNLLTFWEPLAVQFIPKKLPISPAHGIIGACRRFPDVPLLAKPPSLCRP